jgi:Holliday junction resolvase
MNANAKGTRNEHRSMRLLEAAGYAVTRAAASLDAWDLSAPARRTSCSVR